VRNETGKNDRLQKIKEKIEARNQQSPAKAWAVSK
jgi:hypothetical protein